MLFVLVIHLKLYYIIKLINMKYVLKLCTVMLLCLTAAVSHAQITDNRPKLFAAYPDLIRVPESILESVMRSSTGRQVSVNFGSGFTFTGNMFSNIVKYDNLQTAGIRSAALNNTVLSVSKIRKSDGSVLYVGRIFNAGAADGYEIKKSGSNSYTLQKFETARILPVCSL